MAKQHPRTYIYIDGFNLYYRSLKGTPYKWLDIESMCQQLLSDNVDIKAIKYFTARIKERTNSTGPLIANMLTWPLLKHSVLSAK